MSTSYLHQFLAPLKDPLAWIGVFGQALFFSRFLVQWLASEKQGKSVVPLSFWYLSLGGGTLTLFYALWKVDIVFTVAQATGLLVYARNLMLIHRKPPAAA
jgi:lipid-A-disaccharide synthase-like uncharacterized protein